MRVPVISGGKNLFMLAAALGLMLTLTNCKKEKKPSNNSTPTVAEQNPLSGYLSASGFDEDTNAVVNGGDFEFGLKFIPAVSGKMTAIIVKIPDVNTNVKVTIWDAATTDILRTELVQITSSGVDIMKTISPLNLTAGTEYMISMNSNDWYNYTKADNSFATYPVTSGDFSITGYGYSSGNEQLFPSTNSTSYYAGDLSFKFQKN